MNNQNKEETNGEQDFYVGWQPKAGKKARSFLRRKIIFIFVLLLPLIITILALQMPFNDHQFEFLNSVEYTGIYRKKPLPTLTLLQKDRRANINPHLLLVGFGKWGAESVIEDLEKKMDTSLDRHTITFKGKLLYGDGKALLELDPAYQENNLLPKISKAKSSSTETRVRETDELAIQELIGEIIDPKCYFGVMKPGEGLLHKSCAIRCISGGIPPLLRVKNKENESTLSNKNSVLDKAKSVKYNYYLLLGKDGAKINQQILQFVAEEVKIKGKVKKTSGWRYLYINPEEIEILYPESS